MIPTEPRVKIRFPSLRLLLGVSREPHRQPQRQSLLCCVVIQKLEYHLTSVPLCHHSPPQKYTTLPQLTHLSLLGVPPHSAPDLCVHPLFAKYPSSIKTSASWCYEFLPLLIIGKKLKNQRKKTGWISTEAPRLTAGAEHINTRELQGVQSLVCSFLCFCF